MFGKSWGFDVFGSQRVLVYLLMISHKWDGLFETMDFYSCFDAQGKIIARCQTHQEIQALKRMGRPIAEVIELKKEEAVVCSLTSSPSEFNQEY